MSVNRSTQCSVSSLLNDMQMTQNQLVYLYCVTEKEPQLKDSGSLAGNLYVVQHRGLCAIAAAVERGEFGQENLRKNLADIDWIKVKANVHERLIESVMENGPVIPFKFGTLFSTDDSLRAMLAEHVEEFKVILKRLENKEEWGVKIYCDMDKLKSRVAGQEEDVLRIENEINSSSPGKAYFLKKKKADLIEDVAHKRINGCSQESFRLLKRFGSAACINKLLPREVTERSDDMVLNSAFLVGRDRIGDFIDMVDNLKVRYTNGGLFIDCTGPWPAYNFCGLPREKVQNV